MIEFKFPCPSCGQNIQATEAYSGMQINCPACQKPMIVPRVPGAMAAPAAVAPAPAAHSAPAAAPRTQRPAPVTKKSNTKWIVIGSVAGVVLVGAIASILFFGVFSHSADSSSGGGSKTTATSKLSKIQKQANLTGPSAAEIVQKVSDQYAAFTSYSATGTAIADMDMSKVDLKNIPGMDKLPANKKKSKDFKEQMSKPVRSESEFSVKLGRPGFYVVEWETKAGPTQVMKGGVWSAGEGDFISMAKTKYTKMENRDLALASATGVSGGVAGTVPGVFFNDASSQLNAFKSSERGEDATVDGEDCYVLNGDAMGMKVVLWVTKDKFLIKQKQMLIGGKNSTPQMSDAQIDEQLKKLGNLTAKQKADAKAAMKNVKPMLSQMKGTLTETYRDIEINKPVKKEDFKYPLPDNAVLMKSLF